MVSLSNTPLKIVFFGTPQFAADVLSYLLDHQVNIVAVVTRTDKPKGRSGNPVPSPVKEVAISHGLPLYQPPRCSTPEFIEILATYQADLFVVVAYGEIVKEGVLSLPKKGCINVHASLLPKYRGAAPIHRAVINGETETGVCIMHMVKEMDAGDVIASASIPIGSETTYGELELALRGLGAQTLLQTLSSLQLGPVTATPQEHSQATLAKKIELEECRIDWTQPAQIVHNLVRGTNPTPGAWCISSVNGIEKRLKVLRTRVEANKSGKPGEIISRGKEDGLIVACGQGAVRIIELKPEGKRAMSADDMMRGVSPVAFQIS